MIFIRIIGDRVYTYKKSIETKQNVQSIIEELTGLLENDNIALTE